MKMNSIGVLSLLLLAISSSVLGISAPTPAPTSEEDKLATGASDGQDEQDAIPAQAATGASDGQDASPWPQYNAPISRTLYHHTANGSPHNPAIPIFITDNAEAPIVYNGADAVVGNNSTVDDSGTTISFDVRDSREFGGWLDSLTTGDAGSKNMVLLFGSASTGYSEQSWNQMGPELIKKFDELDTAFPKGWIFVTNGDGFYGTKALTDIAVFVASRGTPVIFVQSDYGASFPSVEDGTYWPAYACGGLYGHGVDHWIPEFKPDGSFKGLKHCWGGIAKQGWLGEEAKGMSIEDLEEKAIADIEDPTITTLGNPQTVDGKEVYSFPDKAFLKGCKAKGGFDALESRLAEVIVVGGGAITVEQMGMYKDYVSLLIETTDKDGNDCATTGVDIQESAIRIPIKAEVAAGSETNGRFRAARGVLSPKSI